MPSEPLYPFKEHDDNNKIVMLTQKTRKQNSFIFESYFTASFYPFVEKKKEKKTEEQRNKLTNKMKSMCKKAFKQFNCVGTSLNRRK